MYSGAAKIVFKTVDISELVPTVSTSVGAIVVPSRQGNADEPILITNKAQFITEYGQPIPGDYGHYSALGFLENGNRLYCMRAHKDAKYGGAFITKAGSATANAGIAAGASDPDAYSFGADQLLVFFGKNPGVWNQDIGVRITDVDPAAYTFTVEVYVENDDGVMELTETYDCSRKQVVDGFGQQTYVEDRINGFSNYIIVRDNTAEADTVSPKAQATTLDFVLGSDGSAVTNTEIVLAWNKFANPQEIYVNILINAGYTGLVVQQKMQAICEDRVDCIAVLDTDYSSLNSVATTVTWRTATQLINSSFCALYAPWIKVFDEYNGQVVSIPPSGDIAGIYALTDSIYGASHGAPAGYNRGILKRSLALDFNSATKKAYTSGELDTLQDAQVNPLIIDPGWGIVVFGEDTEQQARSALSDVHVRRLINQIAVSTTKFSKPFLFEPLIERTYFRVRTALEEYMAQLESLGAFDNVNDKGWRVVCDGTTNNPASVRDLNELHIWLFIKPVRVAKYIEIKAVITRSTASFDAIIAAGIV